LQEHSEKLFQIKVERTWLISIVQNPRLLFQTHNLHPTNEYKTTTTHTLKLKDIHIPRQWVCVKPRSISYKENKTKKQQKASVQI